jgi:Zn-finger nucleic acid-binding protein
VKCAHCGAPLPLRSSSCAHCGATHDADLRVLVRPAVRTGASERSCPHCAEALERWRCHLGEPHSELELDRCAGCGGLFFDPHELEAVLATSASASSEADETRLAGLLAETKAFDDRSVRVRYVPCPECGALMHRRGFGARAGVVIDRCREHGVWLDGGELRSLLHWRRSGGEKWDEAQRREVEEETKRAERVKERTAEEGPFDRDGRWLERPWWWDLVDLLTLPGGGGLGRWLR